MIDLKTWRPIATAPDNIPVETKIDDGQGERNIAPLIRHHNLWFLLDKEMYVYYTPTHWRPLV